MTPPPAGPHDHRVCPSCAARGIVATAALVILIAAGESAGQTVPLCAGLTIAGAVSEPHGDYEPIVTVEAVTDTVVSLRYSTQVATTSGTLRKIDVPRSVLVSDLRSATFLQPWLTVSAPSTIPGSTAIGTSSAVLRALKTTGTAELAVVDREHSTLGADRSVSPNIYEHLIVFTLQRLTSGPRTLPIIVNDRTIDLPVIYAVGSQMGETLELALLDDEHNPLGLKTRRHSVLAAGDVEQTQVVKVSFRCPSGGSATPSMERLERALLENGRVDVYDIYFSFNSDEIRKESQPALRDIAALLRRHSGWKLAIEGHTDSIASDAYNLELSQRRAAAVRAALTGGHAIDGRRLTTTGVGEARPKDRNDTIEGRARNRRVELVRQQ